MEDEKKKKKTHEVGGQLWQPQRCSIHRKMNAVAASDSRAPAVTKLGRPAGPTFFLTHSLSEEPAGLAAARLSSTPPRQQCCSLPFALTPFLANSNNNVLRNGLPV
ncbi:unnamed protein product [Sphagnum compactum]